MTIHIGCGRILVCKRNNGNCLSFQLNDSPTLNQDNRITFELSIFVPHNLENFDFSVRCGNIYSIIKFYKIGESYLNIT